MKSILRTIMLAAGILLVPNYALAEGFDLNVQPYLGGGIGAFSLDAAGGSETAFGGFGTIGANLNEYLAVELRVGATSDVTQVNSGVTVDGGVDWFVSYLAKPQFPVTGDLNVYGLVGATTMKTALTIQTPGFVFISTGTTSASSTNTGFTYGAGFEYKLTDQLYVGVEWVQYATDANAAATAFQGLDVWGASGLIKYQF